MNGFVAQIHRKIFYHRDRQPQRWGGPTPPDEKFFGERAGVPENASFLGWDGIPRLCGVLSLWLINCFSRVLARLSIR